MTLITNKRSIIQIVLILFTIKEDTFGKKTFAKILSLLLFATSISMLTKKMPFLKYIDTAES